MTARKTAAMNRQPPAKEEVASEQVLLLPRNRFFVRNPFDRSVAEQNQRFPKLSGVLYVLDVPSSFVQRTM